jgi:hypothetical protein
MDGNSSAIRFLEFSYENVGKADSRQACQYANAIIPRTLRPTASFCTDLRSARGKLPMGTRNLPKVIGITEEAVTALGYLL